MARHGRCVSLFVAFLTTGLAASIPSSAAVAQGTDPALNDSLHRGIFAGLSDGAPVVAGAPCGAVLKLDTPQVVDEAHVGWTGACVDGLAHGDGDLTLLYDTVPMFTAEFRAASGTSMNRGVPMSTLGPDDFRIIQSACLEAGWTLGNRGGAAFAEYPEWAKPNYWTLSQDAMIAELAAGCGRTYTPVRVMMKGEDIVGVVRGKSYADLADTLRSGVLEPQLYSHGDIWNEAIDRYNKHRERVAAEQQADREQAAEAAQTKHRESLAARYADRSLPIDNLADFLEGMGDVRAIEELGRGRAIHISSPEVSFADGVILASFYASPTSAADAVDDLNSEFSWNKWFDVTMNANTPLGRRIQVTCRFELGQLDGIDAGGQFVAQAKLRQLTQGHIVLDCTRG